MFQKQPIQLSGKKKIKKKKAGDDGFGITDQEKRDCSRGSRKQEKENLAMLVRYNQKYVDLLSVVYTENVIFKF